MSSSVESEVCEQLHNDAICSSEMQLHCPAAAGGAMTGGGVSRGVGPRQGPHVSPIPAVLPVGRHGK